MSVIVKFDTPPLATYSGHVAGLAATTPAATGARRLDVRSSAAQAYAAFLEQREQAFAAAVSATAPGARVVFRLRHVIGGVSPVLPRSQVGQLSSIPGVPAVYPSAWRQLLTDRSPTFIRATELWWLVGGPASAGEGVVVGVIDSGAWPEHPSLADPDPAGKSYRAPPSTWTGVGCAFGSAVPGDAFFACSNKLIGARRFMDAYELEGPILPTEFPSARADNGHGTHTSTTAPGNRVVGAAIFGIPRGVISGIAPRAHVAVYKACGDGGCFTAGPGGGHQSGRGRRGGRHQLLDRQYDGERSLHGRRRAGLPRCLRGRRVRRRVGGEQWPRREHHPRGVRSPRARWRHFMA